MSAPELPLAYFYSWDQVPDAMLANVMAEFSWHGVENLVFSHVWLTRILREPFFAGRLFKTARAYHLNLVAAHAPWGQPFDLSCPDRGRRDMLIADHKRAMAYCADSGCRTYTMHPGAFESVFYQTANARIRPLAVDTLEQLLPTAEKLGLTIAVENSYERSNTPDEVVYYMEHFHSPALGCCLDVGHANLMRPFPGKKREKYFTEMDWAWGDKIEEQTGTCEKLAPYVVTCHLHDNDGYSDAHALPGTGTIEWDALLTKIRRMPRLISMQTEVVTIPTALPIAKLVATFRKITGANAKQA